jgi:hypothetical protein
MKLSLQLDVRPLCNIPSVNESASVPFDLLFNSSKTFIFLSSRHRLYRNEYRRLIGRKPVG